MERIPHLLIIALILLAMDAAICGGGIHVSSQNFILGTIDFNTPELACPIEDLSARPLLSLDD